MWTLFWWADFRNVFVVTCRVPREILWRRTHERIQETTSSQLIGVFDAGGCKFFRSLFCACTASARVRIVFLCGRCIDPTPQKVGLRSRGIKLHTFIHALMVSK